MSAWLVARRQSRASRRTVGLVYLGFLVVVAIGWGGLDAVARHFAAVFRDDVGGRFGVWQDAAQGTNGLPLTCATAVMSTRRQVLWVLAVGRAKRGGRVVDEDRPIHVARRHRTYFDRLVSPLLRATTGSVLRRGDRAPGHPSRVLNGRSKAAAAHAKNPALGAPHPWRRLRSIPRAASGGCGLPPSAIGRRGMYWSYPQLRLNYDEGRGDRGRQI
jgi:hypothetical protein